MLEPFLARSPDAYSEWLRPGSGGAVFEVEAATNLDADHDTHQWKRGEGLVGKVWDIGQAAAAGKLKQHPWFKARPGCENETYIAVPMGKPGGAEGVLAVGSDAGFDVRAGDMGLLHAYGELLALAMPTTRAAAALAPRRSWHGRAIGGHRQAPSPEGWVRREADRKPRTVQASRSR